MPMARKDVRCAIFLYTGMDYVTLVVDLGYV